jgi:predicted RNase H-like HicB family nuclease
MTGSLFCPAAITTDEQAEPAHEQAELMSKYLILIEKAGTGYSAHSPDVSGCIATGATLDEVRQVMQEALEFHIEGLLAEGLSIPEPATTIDYVSVAAA